MVDWGSEDKPKAIKLFEGTPKEFSIFLQPSGDYIDVEGTIYPGILFDPGYAGVSPFQTGKGDPLWIAAKPHDKAFNRMKLGYQDSTKDNLKVFGEFSEALGTEALKAAYVLAAAPFYWLIGGVGGLIRWELIAREKK